MNTMLSMETFQAFRTSLESMPPRSVVALVSPRGERYEVTRSTGDFWICGAKFYFAAADMAYAICRSMAREKVSA